MAPVDGREQPFAGLVAPAAAGGDRRGRGGIAAFPVFRFYNESLTARVSAMQRGALLTAPVESFGHHVVEAADEWNLVREVNDNIASVTLLPDLIRTLEEIVAGARGSVARFRTPTRGMFDIDRLDASDLLGLGALTFRTFGRDRQALLRRTRSVRAATRLRDDSNDGADAETAPGASLVVQLDGVTQSIDGLTRWVVAGLLAVPALGNLVPRMAADAGLAFSHWFIELAEGIETSVYDLRRDVLAVFAIDLPIAVEKAFVVVDAIRSFVLDNIRFGSLVGIEVLRGVFGGVSVFGTQMRTMWSELALVIDELARTGQAIVDLDIGEPLHHALESIDSAINNINPILRSESYDAPAQFAVTVGEFVLNTGPGARAQSELRAGVRGLRQAWGNLAFQGAHEWAIEGITGYSPPKMTRALGLLVDALGQPRHVPVAVPAFVFDGSDMDDIGQRIVEPLRRGAENILNGLEADATTAVQGVGSAAHRALAATADAFDAAATRATRTRSLRLIEGITADGDRFLRTIIGDQTASSSDGRFDALAGQYSAWLVQGGFDVIGAALAGYVDQMLDVWTAELDANADLPFDVTETSPRKLLGRASLGRVHTTKMTIGVRADELGRPLASSIAERFDAAITDAYRIGQARLGERLAVTVEPSSTVAAGSAGGERDG